MPIQEGCVLPHVQAAGKILEPTVQFLDIHDVDDWQRNNIHDWHVMIFMPDDVCADYSHRKARAI